MANNNAQNVSNKFVSISRPSKELIGLVLHRDHGFSVSLSFTVTEWLLLSRCLQQTTNRAEMKAIIRKAEPFHRLIDKSFEKLGTSKKVSYVAYVGSIDMSREIVPEQRRLTTCSADRTSYSRFTLRRIRSTGLGPDFGLDRDEVSIFMPRQMFESFRKACASFNKMNFPRQKF